MEYEITYKFYYNDELVHKTTVISRKIKESLGLAIEVTSEIGINWDDIKGTTVREIY